MREENWYKWFFIAMFIHALVIGAFSIPLNGRSKKIDISSYYSVNLVGDVGGEAPQAAAPQATKPAPTPPPETKPTKAKSLPPAPTATSKTRTLAPVKKPLPETTEKDDVRRLDKRIREMQNGDTTSIDEKIRQMRKQVQYMDVTSGVGKGQGSGIASSGGSTPLDPALAQYYNEVREKMMTAWHSLYSAKKDLLTAVTITIRKDGRITDWQIDQRSGNRAYDEAVSRTLRSIDRLPPIPTSLNTDSLELGIRFHPGGDAR
jgi:TonB family protein